MFKLRHPSPALVIALVALFSSLTGGAVAATAVPLAKKALFANNAGKLQGKTAAQLTAAAAAIPGPATSIASVAGMTTIKSAPVALAASQAQEVTVTCDAGQKAIGGGFTTDGLAFALDSAPTPDGSGWRLYLGNLSSSAGASGSAYAICLR